jgi:hypothetical protein
MALYFPLEKAMPYPFILRIYTWMDGVALGERIFFSSNPDCEIVIGKSRHCNYGFHAIWQGN